MVNRQDLVKKANDNGLIYANPQGFGLMDQLSELAKDMAHQKEHNARQNEYNARQNEQIARQNELNARQNEQIARLNEQIARLSEHDAQQEAEIKFLRGQVETLTKINDQSHNIRMRFISKYKRDVLNKATSTDHDAIDAGNIDTHEGNARGDAMLYKLRKRIDEAIYMALYGLGWNLVLNLTHSPTLRILEAHAKVKSVDKEGGKESFYGAFEAFIEAFELGNFQTDYLEYPNSKQTTAYWRFWDEHRNV